MRCLRLIVAALACGIAAQAAAQTAAPSLTQEPPLHAAGELAPAPRQPGDAFGQEVTLPTRTIVYVKGQSGWNGAFEALRAAFKTLRADMDKKGLRAVGPSLVIYTETDDKGFSFEAGIPVSEMPKQPLPAGAAVGEAPSGKALKFVHRGSYDAMDSTYDTITEYLDEKNLDATEPFVEEYVTDPLIAPADRLTVNIYVPVK